MAMSGWDRLQQAWQSQSCGTIGLHPDQLLKADRLERRVHVGVDLFLIAVFSCLGIFMSWHAFRDMQNNWPWLIYVASDVWVVGYILFNRWRRRRKTRFDDTMLAHVERAINETEHRLRQERYRFWWYLLPIALGCMIPTVLIFIPILSLAMDYNNADVTIQIEDKMDHAPPIAKVLKLINDGETEKLYAQLTAGFQQAVPLTQFRAVIDEIKVDCGKLERFTEKKSKGPARVYWVEGEQGACVVTISVDAAGKISGLLLKGSPSSLLEGLMVLLLFLAMFAVIFACIHLVMKYLGRFGQRSVLKKLKMLRELRESLLPSNQEPDV
jgi:hypothetical protein